MMSEKEKLSREIQALEAELEGRAPKASGDDSLLTEIRAMEAKLACMNMGDDEAEQGCGEPAMDDDAMLVESVSLKASRRTSKKAGTETASEVDPNGVEEEITQDRFKAVEDLRDADLSTEDSMLDAAPTGYVARLRSASARLDRVAEYLEKHGKKAMAFRVDKIADAIDARIQKEEGNHE